MASVTEPCSVETPSSKLVRSNEYYAPGFTALDPESIHKIEEESGSIHDEGGINVVKISSDIVVKYGERVSIFEAKNMLYLAKHAKEIPVPRVHGYYAYGPYDRDLRFFAGYHDTYIFMDYVEGDTLEKAWASYDATTKLNISQELKGHFDVLRSLEPESHVGAVDSGPVRDQIFDGCPEKKGFSLILSVSGVDTYGISVRFESLQDFHKAIVDAYTQKAPKAHIRGFLEDMLSQKICPLKFTHGDFRPANIIVKDGKLNGIVDWELSGWYPEYWEFAKSMYIWQYQNDWTDYLLQILTPYYDGFHMHTFLTAILW